MAERIRPTGENGTPPAGSGRRPTREVRPGDLPNPLPISLVDIADYERLHQGQALTLRDFFATMTQERRRGAYGYLHAVIVAESQQAAAAAPIPEDVQKYAEDLHLPLFWAEMRTLDALPFLSLKQKLTLLVGNLFERAHYELPTELFGMNRQTIDSCKDFVADGKTIFNGRDLRQLATSYLANPEQHFPEDASLQDVLRNISDRTPAGAAARREKNVAFSQSDTTGRLGLFLRSIDDMADLPLEQRFALFHQAYRQLYHNGADTNRLTSPLFTMMQLVIATNVPIRLLASVSEPLPPQLHQRWNLLTGRNGQIEQWLRTRADLPEIEDFLGIFEYWVFSMVKKEANHLLGWDDLARLLPRDLRRGIQRPGDRIRLTSLQIDNRHLFPKIMRHGREIPLTNREAIRKHERMQRIERYILQHKGESISLTTLAEIAKCSERTVQVILREMRDEEKELDEAQRIVPQTFHEGVTPKTLQLINAMNALIDSLTGGGMNQEQLKGITDEQWLALLKQNEGFENLSMAELQVILYHAKNRKRLKLPRRLPEYITSEQIEEAKRLHAAYPKMTNRQIAEEIGATRDGVRKALKKASIAATEK